MPSTRAILAVTLALTLALPSCAPRPEAPINVTAALAIQQVRLDNGLVVVLNPDAAAPSALVHVRYHAGAKDDPWGLAGLAHLVEHLTFEASPRKGDPDRMASLERVGAVDVNGTTANDFTDYYETVPPSFLAYALWVEASRMAHPIDGIDENALRGELATVRNELRTRATSDPYRLANELLMPALFGGWHPYGRIANMARNETDAATLPELQAFAAQHYQPANATIVVSGRFDVAEATALVSRYFGRIPSRGAPSREILPAAHLAQDDVATFAAPVRTRVLAIGWLFPPPEKDGHDEILLATRVIATELRAHVMSDQRLVDDVQVDIRGGHLGSILVVEAKLRDAATAERTLSEVDRVMSRVATLGRTFEWDEFRQVRLRLETGVVLGLELPASRASWIQDDLEYAGVVRSVPEEIARMEKLYPWNVGGAVQQFVVDARRAVVVLEPDPTAPPSGARR